MFDPHAFDRSGSGCYCIVVKTGHFSHSTWPLVTENVLEHNEDLNTNITKPIRFHPRLYQPACQHLASACSRKDQGVSGQGER